MTDAPPMSAAETGQAAERVIRLIRADPWPAHRLFFAHRHKDGDEEVAAAPFHKELVEDFWSQERYSQCLAFRGSGKSTLAEEDICLAVSLCAFRNILIIGASETRAAERLAAISYELESNETLEELFGPQQQHGGGDWTQTRIVTRRQVCVQAMGRDQSIRGIKFHDQRPDFVLVDDFEDKENVQTPEARLKTLHWFLAELLPACAPNRRVRVRATPMDAESVPMRLWKESRWPTRVYPVEAAGEDGERAALWPAAFPLPWIDRERRNYERLGAMAIWQREMMCEAVADADQTFRPEQFRVKPQVRSWQGAYAMIDPARSVGRSAATTGWAAWSWTQNPLRLVVWAADAQLLLPDEIVKLGFEIQDRFDPIHLGVEQDGLEEFLLQPFRHEMVRRGAYLPLKGMRAPRGKLDFIRGLQPFFAAGEVEFAQELPALKEQLLNFPRGRIDAPNALAYALIMRPGLPIYENFTEEHLVEDAAHDRGRPLFLVANATASLLAAALCQGDDGRFSIIADFLEEGIPAETVPLVQAKAALIAESVVQKRIAPAALPFAEMLKAAAPDTLVMVRRQPVWIVPPVHGEKWTNVGLRQAIKALPAEARLGGGETAGQLALHHLLDKRHRGLPAVEVGAAAKWTRQAFMGGYARAMLKGRLQDHAEEGPYRLLMEGLESFCALLTGTLASEAAEDVEANYAINRHGRRYESVMPQR